MYKCLKCNKGFKYESKLKEHQNRKISCDQPKKKYYCNICNVSFERPAEQNRHENTEKHINNYNKINNSKEKLELDKNKLETKKLEIIIKNYKLEIDELKNNYKLLNNHNLELDNEIKELNNKIKFLEVENQNLKNNNDIHSDIEYIYIIHCAQHINTNIYKVGRTKDILRRYGEYPKGSKILLTLSCDNSKLIETKILNYLKESADYLHYKPGGNEYFQCDIKILKSDIQKILSEN
jgi:hypothetical protein